jgi:hypothetical protein
MLAWAACALAVSLALGIAALLAEQACRLRGLPTRGCWLAAMALSLLLPLAAPLVPAPGLPRLADLARVPGLQQFAQPLAAIALPARAQAAPAAAREGAPPVARDARLAAVLRVLAAALSAGMLCSLVLASIRLQRRARGWRRTRIAGLDVLLAPSAGPAVFGWWRPRVVLPEWLGRQATRARSLALAHERSHLQALDPQLLAACLLLLAAMPWCLPMWWQLRRLRCAIEVDCDRRVLRAGGDLVDYCETLIALGQHGGAQRGLMAAVPGPQSLLERRIRIMSARPFPWSRSAAVAFTALAVAAATCAVAVATELAPPVPAAPKAPRAAIAPVAPMAPRAAVAALAPLPPAPGAPTAALPAPPAPPAMLAGTRKHAAEGSDAQDEGTPEQQALENAKREAEEAQERADEAKADAEEAERDALEAKRDAEQQAEDAQQAKRDAEQQAAAAQDAKRAAEAAAAEAAARKQDAENAARALHAPTAAS